MAKFKDAAQVETFEQRYQGKARHEAEVVLIGRRRVSKIPRIIAKNVQQIIEEPNVDRTLQVAGYFRSTSTREQSDHCVLIWSVTLM